MEEDDHDNGFSFGTSSAHSPSLVSLAAFPSIPSPSPRRLSSHFTRPSRPVSLPSSAPKLAWVSLQGRLVNAEEASSSRAIKGGLGLQESAAWEMFTPLQRFLIVAVIGVAVAESKKNRVISQLKKSVELRDQVLLSMQQKLDSLCEQLYYAKEQPGGKGVKGKAESSPFGETFGYDRISFVDCGCWLCDQHHDLFTGLAGNSRMKTTCGDDMLQYKMTHASEVEQEERRMSDLSDWASSVTSAAEIQINSFAIEQDIYNLRKECEEKDGIINELNAFVQSANVTGSKRISELEDIIRRKNMIITRLKKDMVVLEQQVVQLTRLRRPSSALASTSPSNCWQSPVMTDNLLYDMDSTTSPSSSDSDSPLMNRPEVSVAKVQRTPVLNGASALRSKEKSVPPKVSTSLVKPTDPHMKSRSVSPLTEISTNQSSRTVSSLRQKQPSARGDFKKNRRQTLHQRM